MLHQTWFIVVINYENIKLSLHYHFIVAIIFLQSSNTADEPNSTYCDWWWGRNFYHLLSNVEVHNDIPNQTDYVDITSNTFKSRL